MPPNCGDKHQFQSTKTISDKKHRVFKSKKKYENLKKNVTAYIYKVYADIFFYNLGI